MIWEFGDIVQWDVIEKAIVNKANLKYSICIRIPMNGGLVKQEDICVFGKDDENKTNSELKRWLQERWFYTETLSSNKSVVPTGGGNKYPKIITSCQENAITFNIGSVDKKLKVIKEKEQKNNTENINEPQNYEIDTSERTKAIKETISEFLGVLKSNDEVIKAYEMNIDYILEYLYQQKDINIKNYKLRLFLDKDIRFYKECNKEYIDRKIFDNSKIVNGIKMGEITTFCSYDSTKPFLKDVGNIHNDTKQVYTLDQGEKLNILSKYLAIENTGKIKCKTGILKYKAEYNSNGKIYFSEFDFTPYAIGDIFEIKPLIIKNILDIKGIEEVLMNKGDSIMRFISSIFEKDALSKYKNKEILKMDSRQYEFLQSYYPIYKDINSSTYNMAKSNILTFTKKLYGVYDGSMRQENYYNKLKIMNFNICAKDYFLDTNMKGIIMDMHDNAKTKILNKTDYNVESVEEFSFMCGQLGRYLKDQSKSGSKDNLLISYELIRNTKSLLQLIERDRVVYGYRIKHSSRVNRVYSGILKYWSSNGNSVVLNREMFLIGLLSNNVFYVKNPKKKENKNNKEK